jgi:predicted ATPase
MSVDDAIVLLNLRRIGNVVDRWKKLQERLAYVFSPRDKWQTIANELFQRKQMKLTASNELQFESRTGKLLTTAMLSSGEKQLLILLTETLLQRGQPAVFIADEPELSLHVLWQEKLIGSLRALNPAAQIIVATHSPDIVGPLSDRAIDMETLIP